MSIVPTFWTPERVARLRELWADETIPALEIAREFGKKVDTIQKARTYYKIPPRHRGGWRSRHRKGPARPKKQAARVVIHLPKWMLPKPVDPTPRAAEFNPFVSEIPWPTKQRMMAGR